MLMRIMKNCVYRAKDNSRYFVKTRPDILAEMIQENPRRVLIIIISPQESFCCLGSGQEYEMLDFRKKFVLPRFDRK